MLLLLSSLSLLLLYDHNNANNDNNDIIIIIVVISINTSWLPGGAPALSRPRARASAPAEGVPDRQTYMIIVINTK